LGRYVTAAIGPAAAAYVGLKNIKLMASHEC
jgi:hypothetical protein